MPVDDLYRLHTEQLRQLNAATEQLVNVLELLLKEINKDTIKPENQIAKQSNLGSYPSDR